MRIYERIREEFRDSNLGRGFIIARVIPSTFIYHRMVSRCTKYLCYQCPVINLEPVTRPGDAECCELSQTCPLWDSTEILR